MNKVKRIKLERVFDISYLPVLGKFWLDIKDRKNRTVSFDGLAEIMALRFALDRAIEAFNREVTEEVRFPMNIEQGEDLITIRFAPQDFIEAAKGKNDEGS